MMKEKHTAKYLTWALDKSKEKLVSINEVKNGLACECFCPACKESLVAKKGEVRMPHFAHKSGSECQTAYETMLHRLAKEKIQKFFYETAEFYIHFEHTSYCTKYKECKYICYDENIDHFIQSHEGCCQKETKHINLKDYYDSCEQEIYYDNSKRRSDLKIYSSQKPNQSPVYIEFCVTHASDTEKLHNGSRIIEIKLENEEDINQLIEHGFINSKRTEFYSIENEEDINQLHEYDFIRKKRQGNYPIVEFYGFKTNDNKNEKINKEVKFARYILYSSGKAMLDYDYSLCQEKIEKSRTNSLLEIIFYNYFINFDCVKYYGYEKIQIPNCFYCKNYVTKYNGNGKICRMYKSLQLNPYNFDTAEAKKCEKYIFNKEEMEDMKKLKEEIDKDIIEVFYNQ